MPQRIGARSGVIGGGKVERCQRPPELGAMGDGGLFHRHAVKKCHERGGPVLQRAQRRAVTRVHRRRAFDAAPGEVVEKPEEKRQILRVHTLFVKRQDEAAFFRAQKIIGIFHALRDALEGEHRAEVVSRNEGLELFAGNFGVDRHGGEFKRR